MELFRKERMKRLYTLFFLLLVVSSVLAEAPDQNLYDYDTLLLKLSIQNEVQIVSQGSPDVDEVVADLSWYPRNTYRQTPEDVMTIPQAHEDKGYQFLWLTPHTNLLSFQLNAMVRTSNTPLPVKAKIPFPIESLPAEMAHYTEPAELINTNEAIRLQALELAGGTDDLFEAVYNVADWVTTNIEYNLTTLTASASQSSTWVMEKRQGVCDELTSLFISMLRSLGIPARFVAGVSYTNLPEFAEPWGGHGWSEVYFPGVGWVPFDVTYGTYGYVDATHIKLSQSFDSGGSSVEYTMRATDANLVTKSLDMGVEVIDKQKSGEEPLSVKMEVFDDLVALESYNLVTATVTNNEDYYLSARLQLAQTQNIEVLNGRKRNILLKPYESKRLTFLVRTEDLDAGFKYDFPIKLYVGLQEVAATTFTARQGGIEYTEHFFDSYIERREERPYNEHIVFDCVTERETAYIREPVGVGCKLTNNGVATLNDVEICLKKCERHNIAPGESLMLHDELICAEPGMKSLMATATHRLINSYGLLRYNCIDNAAVSIEDVAHPGTLNFDERGDISFLVKKVSDTIPENVTVTIKHDNFEQWWEEGELINPQKFVYTIKGENLDLSNNMVTIEVSFKDRLGKPGKSIKTFEIQLGELTFWQKTELWMQGVEQWLAAKLQ